jgi:NAD-dependent dihydropyrimidine dehydrogenase PreA subunit
MTSAPGVFAGGDCVFGPRLIIDSVGDGKRAAVGIDEYLRGSKHSEPQIEVEVLDSWQMATTYMNLHRQAIPMLPLDRRTGMTEVELCYSEREAMAEAQRCLKCYINTILEGSEQDGTDCVLCGGCVDVCPENCLELVSLDRIAFDSMVLDAIANNREAYSFELEAIQSEELGSITGTAMLKDETRCIRCGLCAMRCPANTITMEAYHLVPLEPTGLITIQSFDGPKPAAGPAATAK